MVAASIVMLSRKSFLKGFIMLFGSTALAVFIFLPVVVPRVDAYLQKAPLEFYSSLRNCNCYVQPLGFKSYAHYFYSERQPFQSRYYKHMTGEDFEKWLLNGKIDRPAYFVAKNKSAPDFLSNPNIRLLYSKNGYVFMKRDSCR
jgi:hypothetical protein